MDLSITKQDNCFIGKLIKPNGVELIVKNPYGTEDILREFLEGIYFTNAKELLESFLKQKHHIMKFVANDMERSVHSDQLLQRVQYVSKIKGLMSLVVQEKNLLIQLLPKPGSKFYLHDSEIIFKIISDAQDYMGRNSQQIAS